MAGFVNVARHPVFWKLLRCYFLASHVVLGQPNDSFGTTTKHVEFLISVCHPVAES